LPRAARRGASLFRRAREIDPLGVTTGWIVFHDRRYDEAVRELHTVLAVHPDSSLTLLTLGFALIGNKQPQEAIPILQQNVSIANRSPGSFVSCSQEPMGTLDAAPTPIAWSMRPSGAAKKTISARRFHQPYLALRDHDETFAWFDRASQEKATILQFLEVHPFFDPLPADPRFADLLRRVGLAQP
jgi:tetratricopeptide (TPR) repeat protein